MKTLIITEKPKVSQRIASSLGGELKRKRYGRVPYYIVSENGDEVLVASAAGHLYSLKQDSEGYDFPIFDIGWKPLFEIEKSKSYTRGYIKALETLSQDVDRFIIATDWDIEGELLGYNALRFACGVTDAERMRFSTLVSRELKEAFLNPSEVDRGLVEAGETRHIMDWYWGINISRALMHSVRVRGERFTISAGRVQTPALWMLVIRERDISDFVPEKFYEVLARLKVDGKRISAEHRHGRFTDEAEAKAVVEASNCDEALVVKVEKKPVTRYPPVPFDLGELQSEAFRMYRYTPKRTQQLAQTLYESGLISYPRTSSQKYPPSIGFRRLLEAISKIKGFEKAAQLLAKEKLYPRQGKKDDPAHPAIYPTGLPPKGLGAPEEKLYKLVVSRFMAVFADPAELLNTMVDVSLNKEPFFFKGTLVTKQGWFEYYPFIKVDVVSLPEIVVGDLLKVLSLDLKEGETKPPPRFNPASLIRELEKRGLGTKATRAEIVDTLYRRGYVKDVPIKVTDAGMAVITALEKYVPEMVDEDLTRRFEELVEKIQIGEVDKGVVLDEAKKELIKIIEEFKEKEKEIGGLLVEAFKSTRSRDSTLGKCPDCEGELRIIRSPRTGKSFVGCSNYPKCNTSYPLAQRYQSSPAKKQCPSCNLPMVNIKMGRKKILSCIDPKCKSREKKISVKKEKS